MLNFPPVTVWRIIRQFKRIQDLGKSVEDKRIGLFKKLPHNIQQELVSPELLQEWARHSLRVRPALIKQRFDIDISQRMLERLYKHHRVKCKATKQIYRQTLQNIDIVDRKRAEFAVTLTEAIETGRPIYYFDESRVDNWSLQ